MASEWGGPSQVAGQPSRALNPAILHASIAVASEPPDASVRVPDEPSGCRTRAFLVDSRQMASPILLLDAFSLLYRAFFALPPLTTRAGEPTSGLYGLSVLLLKLLREQRPKGAVFALDLPRPTFRHERWDGYKASRQRPPSALGHQVGRLREVIAAFRFPALASPGFEADDVLATLAAELAAAGEAPMVVSGDRDSLQLARG